MEIPHAVLAGGWIPFTVVLVLTFIFSWVYIRLFQHHDSSKVASTLGSIIGLFITLLTIALVPVDVFLVSYMKNPDGSFKDWVNDNSTRNSIESTVTYAYYTLYGLVGLFVFLVLPFMYFFFEDPEEDELSTKQKCCTSLKYTVVFLIIAFVILMTGAFVPLKTPSSQNITGIDDKIDFLKDQLHQYTHADQAMSIMVGVMSMFGMFTLILYTGYGMSALPLGMIRCCRKYEETESNPRRVTKKERDADKLNALRTKSNSGRNLSRYERNELRRLEQDERIQHRVDRKKSRMKNNCLGKAQRILKPFEVVFGFAFLAISLLMMISLTITNVDKELNSLGYKQGYSLPVPKLPNPVNIIMVHASKVFPLDYVLFSGMALFFIFASMNGLKRMGIWCCCIRLFKIRTGRTMPQALLFMVFIMMFMVLGVTIVLFNITPQYVQYGNQMYQHHTKSTNGTISTDVKKCTTDAPKGNCTMSSLALLLNTLFYKAWFFGAFYHWSIWFLLLVYYMAFLYNSFSIFRTRSEAEMIDSDDDESDEERLITA